MNTSETMPEGTNHDGPIVGIDLGTTNSAVAGIVHGKLQVIKLDGKPTMPSIVGLNASGKLVTGLTARNQLAAFPDRTVASIKRKMGTDERIHLADQEYSPPEVSAMILRTLKDAASQMMGVEVSRAVITVPAYFDELQRQATRKAGEIAGLKVERIVNEPTAATLVYHVDKKDRKHVAIYDLGGGTFDVSIVRMEDGVIEVLSSRGDTHLGGDDFDNLLLDHVASNFLKLHGIDLRKEPQSRFRLLQACEMAKIQLSELETVEIAEEFIAEKEGQPLHLRETITRNEFEEMIAPWIDKTLDCVGKALQDSSLVAHQIDDLVLVGGSTRIPMVESRLREQFMREPSRSVDPDLAVALGAAVQAAMLNGESIGPVLVDVATHTLGVEACVGMTYAGEQLESIPIIHRGTPLPARFEMPFSKLFPEQKKVCVSILQGEHRNPDDNTLIGELDLELSDEMEGHEKIIVHFHLTLDGVLRVIAKQPATGRMEEVSIDDARNAAAMERMEPNSNRLGDMFSEMSPMEVSVDSDDVHTLDDDSSLHRIDRSHDEAAGAKLRAMEIAKEKYPKVASLLDLADKLRSKVQGEDLEEMDDLCEQLVDAIENDDRDEIESLKTSLDDLLFYVQ